jgi:hypothetical protein
MKKLFYLFTILFAALFTACEPSEPGIPSKVETGAAENITSTSATLKGMVNVDIIDYEEIVFGVLYSTKAEELATLAAPSKNGLVLVGNEFKVEVTDLTAETKYYYRAYVMLNTLQILLGDVKEFTTLPTNANPDTPEQPEDPGSSSFVAKPFSVSATKTVTFSPGNLQYHPANNEWRFAPSQLDYIGNDNANISATYKGWIDLFGWGTGNNPANNSTNNDDYPTFVDWGVNKIGNDAPNTWRTLTYNEWEYLIEERPNYDKLIAVAQVNGVNGVILLPDDWTCPSGVTFKSGFDDDDCIECYANYQTVSESDWAVLEASGAVFFPASGNRSGSSVYEVQESVYFWTATAASYGATRLFFYPDAAYMNDYYRYGGMSVRLVRD